MTARTLAWRTVAAEPARAILAVIGVAVIGALLFDMLMLSSGLLVSFRRLLDTAGYDVRVAASDGLSLLRVPIPDAASLVDEIAGLPEVEEVALVRRERAAVQVPSRGVQFATLVSVSAGAERRAWRIVSGEGLEAAAADGGAPPLVVGERLAGVAGLEPGQVVRVRLAPAGERSALPPVEFRVVGIADFQFEPTNDYVATTTPDGFERARAGAGGDEADAVLVRSRASAGPSAAVAAIGALRSDVRAFSNADLVSQVNENGFAYFRQISFVLSSITLGFAFLLVATLLTVSVNQRLGDVAALRAIGIPRSRIAAMLFWESAWLIGAGGLLSLPLGGLLAVQLDRILRGMPGIPEGVHFFVFEPGAAVTHLVLLAGTGLAASIYPVWVATRLPIAATLRRETVS